MHQEPAASQLELLNTLRYVRPGNGFVPKMDMFSKINVNGDTEIKLYSYLKSVCPRPDDVIASSSSTLWSPIRTSDVYWNFEKFLIDHKGMPLKRYSVGSLPVVMENDIKKLIQVCEADRVKHLMFNEYLPN